MIREFFNHSLVYGLATILSRGLSLLLVPLYTRILSPVDYGAIDILTILGNFASLIVTLEISQGFARYLPEGATEADRAAYASTTLWYTVAAYIVFVAAAMVLSDRICLLVMESLQWVGIVRLAICSVAVNGVFLVLHSQLRWGLQAKQYAAVSLVLMLVATAVSLVAVVVLRWGVTGIFYGQIAGTVVGGALSWRLSRGRFSLVFDRGRCWQMLRFSIPLVPSSINVFIALYLDRIAIKQLMTLNDVGLYGIAYRFASVVSLFMAGATMSLTPLIYNKHELSTTPSEIARIFRYFLVLALSLLVAMAAFSRELLVILTTPRYYSAWSVMPVIAGAILVSSMYIFMPGMDITKKTSCITLINLAAGVANVVLNFALIPILGIMGAAVATLCASLLMFSLYAFFSQRLYPVPHQWFRIAAAAILCALVVAVALHAESSLALPGHLLIPAKMALCIAVVMVFCRLLMYPSELRHLLERLVITAERKIT